MTNPIRTPASNSMPTSLRENLVSRGLVEADAEIVALGGGRTNRLWRFKRGPRMLVCKLYATGETPLFPNDPNAEVTALKVLSKTGLAPEFVESFSDAQGIVVIYEHVDGTSWIAGVSDVSAALCQLHKILPPQGLRRVPKGGRAVIGQGKKMLGAIKNPQSERLMQAMPRIVDQPEVPAVFLHGDVIAENVIRTANGVCLIDWQCPAIGDPIEDLATFLSPAMHQVYGGHVLTAVEERKFLAGYGDATVVARYKDLAPAYHWRMAAYCLWKASRGDPDYMAGFWLELARLNELCQPRAQ